MKQLFVTLSSLLKRGYLRIFPKHGTLKLWNSGTLALCAILTLLTVYGCSSARHITTQLVRDVRVDTVYLSNKQYDSIYIHKDRVSEHHLGTLPATTSDGKYLNTPMRTDTLYIKDVSIEYRYKLLKDTIRVVERDSIPYQVTVTETKEITRPLTWYDHLTRLTFWFVFGYLLSIIFFKLKSKICL